MNAQEAISVNHSEVEPAATAAILHRPWEVDLAAAKRAVNRDLMLVCFYDEFRSDAARATDLLLDLLLDLVTCEARCILLTKASDSPEGTRLFPAGFLSEPREFLRELLWIATGRLRQAVESGKADVEHLGQLASHPDVLRMAHRAVMEGGEVLVDLVKEHQAEAWSWLRGEVVSGRLREQMGDGIGGRHVAIWRKEQAYDEFEVGDDPHAVRIAVAERWMVPDELIAETFVDLV